MEAWIVILVVVAVFALLAVGGAIARQRQLQRTEGRFETHLDAVNQDLAAARAEDKGWDPDRLDAAARAAWAEHGSGPADELALVQVVDPPGTEEDKAIFRITGAGGDRRMTMGRRGDDWVLEGLD